MTTQRDNTTTYPREIKIPYLGKEVNPKQHQPLPKLGGEAWVTHTALLL